MTIQGALHIHSKYSYDGQESLVRIKEELISWGISFACVTEHVDALSENKAEEFIKECHALSGSDFILIPGFEAPYLGTHLILINVQAYGYDSNNVPQSIKKWISEGAMAIVAHPHRNGFQYDDFMLEHTTGSEIWNSQYDGKLAPRLKALQWFRELKKKKDSYLAFGSMDMHRIYHLGGPQVVINGGTLSTSYILESIRAGRYVIERGPVTIDSKGDILSGSAFLLHIVGSISVAMITIGKKCSRFLRRMGLHSLPGISLLRRKIRGSF
jgi:hypothetical protein